jgi:chaperonin GroES
MIEPMFDRIIVRPLDETKNSTIIVPDKSKPRPCTGLVLAVGDGLVKETGAVRLPAVKPGDKVMFKNGAGTRIEVEGEIAFLLREMEIYGVWEED